MISMLRHETPEQAIVRRDEISVFILSEPSVLASMDSIKYDAWLVPSFSLQCIT